MTRSRRFDRPYSLVSVAGAVVLLGLAAGCGGGEPAVLRSSAVEISDALAFRDGEPSIEIMEPMDHGLYTSPVFLRVNTRNLRLSPAGETRDGEGHLHVLVDQGCVSPGLIIESGSTVVDLSDGRSIVELDLSLGHHEICVQMGDGFSTAVRIVDQVSITVVEGLGFGSHQP